MSNIGNIASALIPILFHPPAAGAAAPAAAPQTPAEPGESVSLGQSPQPEAAGPKPQWQIDGPVVPLEAPLAPKKWTVGLFSASDNNLYRFMQEDVDEAERIGSSENMNLIVQTDHAPAGGGAKIYELVKDDKPQLHSPVRADLGNVNMGDKNELSRFVQFLKANYPAEHYMVIVSDHGGGPDGACSDDSKGGWMNIQDIREGLADQREKTGSGIDVLGFDACLMANAEVAHELKGEVKFLVGSEETEGGAGWQYDETLKEKGSRSSNRLLNADVIEGANTAMRSREGDFSPAEFASRIVEMAKGHQGDLATMSAYDTEKVGAVAEAVKGFGKAILESGVPLIEFKKAKKSAQGFYQDKDLSDFAAKVASVPGAEDKLKEAAKAVQDAIDGCTIAEQHSTKYPGAHGMTIRLNQTRDAEGQAVASLIPGLEPEKSIKAPRKPYSDTMFAKDTDWQKVQDRLAQKVDGFAEEDSLMLPGGLTPEDLINIVGGLLGGFLASHGGGGEVNRPQA